jgi:rod shape-determining protein MreD
MSAARRLPAPVETALFLGFGFVAVLAPKIPLAPGAGLMAPDLLYCLTVAWMIRRPRSAPLPAVVGLGLFADLMLSRPLGLGALGLLVASELFRARAATFHGLPFPVEWLAATLVFAAMLGSEQLALLLVFAEAPGVAPLARHLVATALAYPVVVLGLAWCLQLRAPRAPRPGNPLGRLP